MGHILGIAEVLGGYFGLGKLHSYVVFLVFLDLILMLVCETGDGGM